MADMNMSIETGNIINGYIVDGVITTGLNLLVAPKVGNKGSRFALGFALCVAGGRGFIGRKPKQGTVLYFSLENSAKETKQMATDIQSNIETENITFIYAYTPGYFGEKIEDGMDVFLRDNPKIKFIVIDSIEKIVESEIDQIEYIYAYKKLCALKKVVSRHGVGLLTVTHVGDSEDSDRVVGIADTVLWET